MRIPRIYLPIPLASGGSVALSDNAANHIIRVLRLKPGAPLILFNGLGGEYEAVLRGMDRSRAEVSVGNYLAHETESPLHVTLAQGVSRGERMDYTIQKAVELGVTKIVPLISERCEVRLEGERLTKRVQHWQAVAASACEQCGRNRVPLVLPPAPLSSWLAEPAHGLRLVLDPLAAATLTSLSRPDDRLITLLIGPEGGLSDAEVKSAQQSGFEGIRLGPRILRTETAAVTALSALQLLWGDLG